MNMARARSKPNLNVTPKRAQSLRDDVLFTCFPRELDYFTQFVSIHIVHMFFNIQRQ